MLEVNLFTYLNAITKKQKSLKEYICFFEETDEFKNFVPFMIMKYLYFGDFIFQANILNKYLYVLNKIQAFIMLYKIVPINYKFIKYIKKVKNENLLVEYVMKYYKVNNNNALDYLKMMTHDEKKILLIKYALNDKEIKKIIKKGNKLCVV